MRTSPVMKIALGLGTTPAEYNENSTSPAGYVCDENTCLLFNSPEWSMADKLGLEIEYTSIVLTHEQLHHTIGKILGRQPRNEKLIHLGDICSLLGF